MLWSGVTTTWGIISKGLSVRKAENHWSTYELFRLSGMRMWACRHSAPRNWWGSELKEGGFKGGPRQVTLRRKKWSCIFNCEQGLKLASSKKTHHQLWSFSFEDPSHQLAYPWQGTGGGSWPFTTALNGNLPHLVIQNQGSRLESQQTWKPPKQGKETGSKGTSLEDFARLL